MVHTQSRDARKKKENCLVAASKNLASAVTTDGDTAALGEGLDDRLDLESDLDGKAGDGVDLGAVVDGVLVDDGVDVDGEAPGGVDLLDGSADVHEEAAVAVVRALAREREVELELDGGHAEGVLERPAEGTPGHVTEALEVHPLDVLRDDARPVVLVVDDGLAGLDDLPDLLADRDELVDVDVLAEGRLHAGLGKQVGGHRVLHHDRAVRRDGHRDARRAQLIVRHGEGDARQRQHNNSKTHSVGSKKESSQQVVHSGVFSQKIKKREKKKKKREEGKQRKGKEKQKTEIKKKENRKRRFCEELLYIVL